MGDRNYEVFQDGGTLIKAWVRGVQLEEEARQQLINVSQLPFIHKWIAVCPDVHWGMGATIGSVIPTKNAIIPAAVGVDIGCGMQAVKTNWTASDLPDSLLGIRNAIEAAVPHGRTNNGGSGDRGAWGTPNRKIEDRYLIYCQPEELDRLQEKHPKLKKANVVNHLGTLGTGNHFIEVCLDEEDRVWVMLHSGSRGIGNRIGSYFIQLAKKDMEKWFINLPDKNLSYLPEGTEHFNDYFAAVNWAQHFAKSSRNIMMDWTLAAMEKSVGKKIDYGFNFVDCHHNYVSRESHYGVNVFVTRKGAVRARKGDLGIIPGSMGARSYIVRGLGNKESFNSCSHGAGRVMSRRQAKEEISLDEHAERTSGVECRKDEGVLDESPGAYKDIDAVMVAQKDLVEIVHTLKQVVCVKG